MVITYNHAKLKRRQPRVYLLQSTENDSMINKEHNAKLGKSTPLKLRYGYDNQANF